MDSYHTSGGGDTRHHHQSQLVAYSLKIGVGGGAHSNHPNFGINNQNLLNQTTPQHS
jgi:hypothetical protein